ncbi:hypothetical protein F5Y17DRAFT_121275 [Xylariaceae sp. FL0594]|nr:hypothetical protein F5Y17DRAFT_121275 [Xylariaceae sp. FL0594]
MWPDGGGLLAVTQLHCIYILAAYESPTLRPRDRHGLVLGRLPSASRLPRNGGSYCGGAILWRSIIPSAVQATILCPTDKIFARSSIREVAALWLSSVSAATRHGTIPPDVEHVSLPVSGGDNSACRRSQGSSLESEETNKHQKQELRSTIALSNVYTDIAKQDHASRRIYARAFKDTC